jgi:type III secretion system low calcium response chaperone LcrH/SycD
VAENATPTIDLAKSCALFASMAAGKTTIAELEGETPQSLEAVYRVAYDLYRQAKYREAMRFFAYLLTLNHVDRRFHTGFGACLQMQGQHEEALKFYSVASLLKLTDPAPVMHAAECHLALGRRDEALQAIRFALCQARAKKEHQGLVGRLEAMLAFLDNEAPKEN